MEKIYFKTEQLTVGYDGKPLVKNIEISLERGKILTLIGPNGAGKSTILKSITGQLPKISGTVYIGGSPADQIGGKELAKTMSVVLTERIRPELMTCWDVAAAGRYPYTGRLGVLSEHDRAKVEEALRLVGMEEYRDTDFRNVSDGQQQRIILAKAICQEPEIIILDEPTSYLDIRHKLAMLQILRSLVRKENVTVIMSLHEIELAQKISDYILCVRGEYVHRYGTPEEIFTSEYISELYDLDNGCYNEIFGSVELKCLQSEAAAPSEREARKGGASVFVGIGQEHQSAAAEQKKRQNAEDEQGKKQQNAEDEREKKQQNAQDEQKDQQQNAGAAGENKRQSPEKVVPEIFVIAGGGSGASVFRRLQREGIPFAAGVLHKNDIDYELARMLACRVISERAYERISEAAYKEASDVMKQCGRVICCLSETDFGEMNERNRELWQEAQRTELDWIRKDGMGQLPINGGK